jgi:pimeloyl-ACP methyl ester carboxylesterase
LDDSVVNWAMEGYVTIATQYQGLGTPGPHWYMIALPQAHSIFDGIRATLNLNDYLKRTLVRNDVIIGGNSQGGHAVLSAAKYHKDYAPEVNVLGFAPSSFGDLFLLLGYFTSENNKHTPSWAVRWYQYQTEVLHLKVPNPFSSEDMYDKMKKWAHETPFAQGKLLQYAGTDYEHIFAPEFYKAAMSNNWEALPAWKESIEGNLPIPSTKIPIILTTGGRDPNIVEERARGLYQRIKRAGNDIRWLYYPESVHGGVDWSGFKKPHAAHEDLKDWILDRLEHTTTHFDSKPRPVHE